jgi:dUTP pyrophosphatase
MNIKLGKDAKMPTRAHYSDAGLDLYCSSREFSNGQAIYKTGVSLEIPDGHVGLLFPRSSIVNTGLRLANCVGVIDAGYRGEISFVFDVKEFRSNNYAKGDRVGQLVILPIYVSNLNQVDELNETKRGAGGYGSTGK